MTKPELLHAKAIELRALAAQARVPEVIVQLEVWAREFEEEAQRAELPVAPVVALTPKFGGAR
jgi:hypothetical protein